jgi:hypothetical protein
MPSANIRNVDGTPIVPHAQRFCRTHMPAVAGEDARHTACHATGGSDARPLSVGRSEVCAQSARPSGKIAPLFADIAYTLLFFHRGNPESRDEISWNSPASSSSLHQAHRRKRTTYFLCREISKSTPLFLLSILLSGGPMARCQPWAQDLKRTAMTHSELSRTPFPHVHIFKG